MSGISVSGVKAGEFCQPQTAAPEGKKLAEALREKRDSQPDLTEMMKEAREKAAEREKMFKIPQNSQRYGDAALLAYALILAINRPIEMLVTSLNVVGDAATTVIVSKSENEFDPKIYNS